MRRSVKTDHSLFLEALSMWDRPMEELHRKEIDADFDVDSFVEGAISSLSKREKISR